MGGKKGKKKKEERKKERAVGAGSTVFQTTCTLRRELSHLLLETELGGLEPPDVGWGATTPVSAMSPAACWARQPHLTCGLCVPGPPSASVPPEQLLPGPNPVKMESSSGPLRFCS